MASYLKRLLGFGTDKNPLESKGVWVFVFGLAIAAYYWFGNAGSPDPAVVEAAGEKAVEMLAVFSSIAAFLRMITSFVKK